jgi:hypothetical protein
MAGISVVWVIGGCILFFGSPRRRRLGAILSALVLAVTVSAVGCGGGAGSGGGGGNPGTPVGNYTNVNVTVTIGSITQSINNLTVNVQ